jgi:AraC family transcriptional regulator
VNDAPGVIEVRRLAPQATAVIRLAVAPREIGPALGEALPEVWEHVQRAGVPAVGGPFARYFVFGERSVDLEAGFPVERPVAPGGRVVPGELPGGEAAVLVHHGPYDELPRAHEVLGAWVKKRGRVAAGAPWEVYVTDPGEEPDPARWQTDVVWPLAAPA